MTPLRENKPVFTITLHNRTLQLTREGGGFIMLVLGVGLGAINTGNNLLYLILAMCCSLIAVSGILSELMLKQLGVTIRHPETFFAREPISIFLSITNGKKRFPSYSLSFDIPADFRGRCALESPVYLLHVNAGATVQKTSRMTASQRGSLSLPAIRVSTGFPFGFFIKTKIIPISFQAVVYPPITLVSIPTPNEVSASGEEMIKARGDDLYALRDFETGDPLDAVHWKSSAKTGALRVKEFAGGGRESFTVFLNLHNPRTDQPVSSSEMEKRIEETASLVYHLIRRGDNVALKTHDLETDYDNSEQHLNSILHYLAFAGLPEHPVTPSSHARA